ncbi:hypothetical protein L204_103734 [Cryptococcus depauperatus]|nr:hypothetical protein L204_02050 [Cryptococcus depauperatus CBS 7855]
MPIEVTPAPHQMGAAAYAHQGWFSLPATGPAHLADLQPRSHIPGSVFPNGLRNPFAPYAGETYIPSADKAVRIGGSRFAGSDALIRGGSVVDSMTGRPMSLAGGSVIAPSSVSMDGFREDEGWNGSMSRVHAGHAPDMSSAAVTLSLPRGLEVGWRNQPASWGNHARMTPATPGLAGPGMASSLDGPLPVQNHHKHYSSSVPAVRLRRNSVSEQDCADCNPVKPNGHGRRRLSSTPVAIGKSPLGRKISVDQVRRSNSMRSNRCSECC